MRWGFYLAVAGAGLFVGSCAGSITLPVVVVSKGVPGGIMRGDNTCQFPGGSFNVSNGTLSCGGSYNPFDQSMTITIPVLCSDGRKGLVIATRDLSGMSGGGHFTLNDGTPGDFMFGAEAGKL